MNALKAMLSRLRAASSRERTLVAACILLGLAIAIGKGAIVPAYAQHRKDLAGIRELVSTIERYEAYRRDQGRADEELLRLGELLKKWEKGLLEGESASAAGVFLQGLLKPLTLKPQTRVTAIRALPPVRKGAYAEISVQMDFQTTTEELAQILADISRQPKSLKVRKYSATVGAYYGRQQQMAPRKENVMVSMEVSGLTAAPLEGKPAAGGVRP